MNSLLFLLDVRRERSRNFYLPGKKMFVKKFLNIFLTITPSSSKLSFILCYLSTYVLANIATRRKQNIHKPLSVQMSHSLSRFAFALIKLLNSLSQINCWFLFISSLFVYWESWKELFLSVSKTQKKISHEYRSKLYGNILVGWENNKFLFLFSPAQKFILFSLSSRKRLEELSTFDFHK